MNILKTLPLTAAGLVLAGQCHAITLAGWAFETQTDPSDNTSIDVAANTLATGVDSAVIQATGSDINRWRLRDFNGQIDDNVLLVTTDNDWSGSNTIQDAFNGGSYFELTITAGTGQLLDLNTLSFDVARGGSSEERDWAVRSSLTGSTDLDSAIPEPNIVNLDNTVANDGMRSVSIDLSALTEFDTPVNSVTFTFIVALDGGNSSMIWDNIELDGNVIPEPGSLALMGLGGLMILSRKRLD